MKHIPRPGAPAEPSVGAFFDARDLGPSRRHVSPLAQAAVAGLWVLLAGVSACESDPFQGTLVPCRCDVEQCTSASCGYELRLEQSCAGQLDGAEILIDGHLEVKPLVPGGAVLPCSRTEPGVESEIIVRGGDWVWGPLHERCVTPGETRLLVLQCIEAAP